VTEQFGVTGVVALTEDRVGLGLGRVDSSAPPSSVFSIVMILLTVSGGQKRNQK
jgi:hypothetical protein